MPIASFSRCCKGIKKCLCGKRCICKCRLCRCNPAYKKKKEKEPS